MREQQIEDCLFLFIRSFIVYQCLMLMMRFITVDGMLVAGGHVIHMHIHTLNIHIVWK